MNAANALTFDVQHPQMLSDVFFTDVDENGSGDLHRHFAGEALQQSVHKVHDVHALRGAERLRVVSPQLPLEHPQIVFVQLLQGLTQSLRGNRANK